MFRFGFKVGKNKSRVFLNLFMFFFFYISRCKWHHDRFKSRNDPHVKLEANATNHGQNHHSYAISTNDTS